MSITTRYGSEVQILERLPKGWLKVKRLSDGAIREWHRTDLRGDTDQERRELIGCTCKHDLSNGAGHASECPFEQELCGVAI